MLSASLCIGCCSKPQEEEGRSLLQLKVLPEKKNDEMDFGAPPICGQKDSRGQREIIKSAEKRGSLKQMSLLLKREKTNCCQQ